jgi:hypothetical protein
LSSFPADFSTESIAVFSSQFFPHQSTDCPTFSSPFLSTYSTTLQSTNLSSFSFTVFSTNSTTFSAFFSTDFHAFEETLQSAHECPE